VLKLAIALSVLLFTCAIAKTADAQPRNCMVPLGHMMPAGCTQADADARRQMIINGYRARAEETQIYRDYQEERDYNRRRSYRVPADEIRFGVHPGPMGTLYGRPMGREGQCDRNGCYGSGSYAYDGYDYGYYGNGWYHHRGVYIYPYAEEGVDMHVPPEPPRDVYVGGGRGWKCRHLERAWQCQVGSTTGEKVLMATALGVLIYALAN
jgi:hypothetical protein